VAGEWRVWVSGNGGNRGRDRGREDAEDDGRRARGGERVVRVTEGYGGLRRVGRIKEGAEECVV
jgi:hypothetical protein